jgi:hypothetical protein
MPLWREFMNEAHQSAGAADAGRCERRYDPPTGFFAIVLWNTRARRYVVALVACAATSHRVSTVR